MFQNLQSVDFFLFVYIHNETEKFPKNKTETRGPRYRCTGFKQF